MDPQSIRIVTIVVNAKTCYNTRTKSPKRFWFHDEGRLDCDDFKIYFLNCVLQVENCFAYSTGALKWTVGGFLEKYSFLC